MDESRRGARRGGHGRVAPVKVTTYLVDGADMSKLGPVRGGFLGDARPASTLVVVKALARPEWLFEVEATAFLPTSQ